MTMLIETISATAQNLYAVIHNPNGQVWNQTLNAGLGGWENYASGHWAQYAIALTEQAGSGYYSAAYPAAISGVLTTEVLYNNATPTLGDAAVGLGQSQGSNMAAVGGDATAPAKLQNSLATMVLGAVSAGVLTASAFTTDVVNSNANAYQGLALKFVTGVLAGQGGTIAAYDPATGQITMTAPFTGAPSVNDVFILL
jgi:hypothetical protein